MPNLATIANASNTALSLSNLILVTPEPTGYQPQNVIVNADDGSVPAQPESFLFDYEGEQTVALTSDITDHFVEDNTAIQDQIALKPELITTHGFVGELNDVAPAALKTLKTIANKLTATTAYAPSLSTTALISYNQAVQLYTTARNLADNAVATWGSINGAKAGISVIDGNEIVIRKNQNKQQVAFQKFYGYWRSRTLFTIETPWAIFENCAIQSLRAVQDAESRVITDFEITFKLMRFADTILTFIEGEQVTYNPQNFQGRAFNQGSSLVDHGVVSPSAGPELTSLLGL